MFVREQVKYSTRKGEHAHVDSQYELVVSKEQYVHRYKFILKSQQRYLGIKCVEVQVTVVVTKPFAQRLELKCFILFEIHHALVKNMV